MSSFISPLNADFNIPNIICSDNSHFNREVSSLFPYLLSTKPKQAPFSLVKWLIWYWGKSMNKSFQWSMCESTNDSIE